MAATAADVLIETLHDWGVEVTSRHPGDIPAFIRELHLFSQRVPLAGRIP